MTDAAVNVRPGQCPSDGPHRAGRLAVEEVRMLPAFGWQAVLTRWEFAPVVTAAVLAIGALYLWGVWRVGRRHPARQTPHR